ncbi:MULTISPECIES: DUF4271 domain-containing protein [Chitinophagaceae]
MTHCLWMVVFVFCTFLSSQAQTTQKDTQTKPKTDTPRTVKPKVHTATATNTSKDTGNHKNAAPHPSFATQRKTVDSTVKKKMATQPITARTKDSSVILQHTPITKPRAARDTIHPENHTIAQHTNHHPTRTNDPLWEKTITVPYLPLKAKPIFVMDELHPYTSKDTLFFIVCGLFLLYGIVRTTFPKYTNSLFQNLVSFSSLDKGETSMGQNNLPSLLLNILFCMSSGLLAALMVDQVKTLHFPFWQMWLFGSLALGSIYLVKFLTIYLSGWIFDATSDAGTYVYVVFMVNKIIGILCLPAILIFAFADNPVLNQYIITIGSIVLIVLLLYRYVVTFSVIARNLQLNAFHFFLYLCSVEIIPMLVLYKLFFKDLINRI